MRQRILLIGLIILISLAGCSPVAVGHASSAEENQKGLMKSTEPTLLPIPADPVPVQAASASPTSTAQGMPDKRAEAAAAPDTYCLWPGDTLTSVAQAAQVNLSQLETLNSSATSYAGAAILLPPGSVPPENWGLHMPAVNSTADLPEGVSGYYLGLDNRHKRVALTFDIGYVPENQDRMVWLHEHGIPATFFVMGISVSRHPEVAAAVEANGHTIGNHSWDHLNFQGLNADEIQAELDKTEQAVQAADPSATTKPYFRAPFGAVTPQVQLIIRQSGYQTIGWTVDSLDWIEGATSDQVYDQVTHHVCPGAIITMHDANPANSAALPRIIEFLQAKDYQIVPLKDLLGF